MLSKQSIDFSNIKGKNILHSSDSTSFNTITLSDQQIQENLILNESIKTKENINE